MARKPYEGGGVMFGWITANFLGVAAIGALILIYPFLKFIVTKLLYTSFQFPQQVFIA